MFPHLRSHQRHPRACAASALLALVASGVCAADATPAPQPFIEAGHHLVRINEIDADAAGQRLISIGSDDTVRVRDVKSRRLLHVLRPSALKPGMAWLRYGALSPDGKKALLGISGFEGTPDALLLFDVDTEQVLRRIPLEGRLSDLAFSPDGQQFAAIHGLSLAVWQIDGTLLAEESLPEGGRMALDWHSKGGLIVSGSQSPIRHYAGPFQKGPLPKPRELQPTSPPVNLVAPRHIKFAGDGATFGLAGATGLDLYQTDTLAFSKNIPCSQRTPWSFVLSHDGKTAFVGNSSDTSGKGLIAIWRLESGQEPALSFPASLASRRAFRLCSVGTDQVAFCTFDDQLGLVSAEGELQWLLEKPGYDFLGADSKLLLNPDGTALILESSVRQSKRLAFSLAQRKFGELPADGLRPDGFSPPVQDGVPVTNWYEPRNHADMIKFNGQPLLQGKPTRCLAVAPDHSKFYFDTFTELHCYSKEGKALWTHQLPANCYAINLTKDGGMAVVALDDSTVRWLSTAEKPPSGGRDLLTLFPSNDGKRWVIFTPQGYYDGSADGESLLGMKTDRGESEAALFTPMSQLKDRYHRLDIVQAVFRARDTGKASELAPRGAPQSVKSPAR